MSLLKFLIICCLITCSKDCGFEPRGYWKLDRAIPGYAIEISENDALGLIGSQMLVSDSVWTFDKIAITEPKYEVRKEATSNVFPIYRLNAGAVGILSDSICLVDVIGNNGSWSYMIFYEEQLILSYAGWFFHFSRI